MKINIKGFIYHKENENYAGCHDRYAYNLENYSFAIADGVSRSFFPDIWAEILVNGFVSIENKKDFVSKLNTYRQEWFENVKVQVEKPNQKWFVKNKFYNQYPAAATFVGLSFIKKPDNLYYWKSQALGDSFLFFIPKSERQIKEDLSNIISLSSKKDFEFDNFPDYFVSRDINNKGEIKYKEDVLRVGTFYLMTDALSEWFIKYRNQAILEINNWNKQETFVNSITNLRKENKLENDDSAILVIEIEDDDNKGELTFFKDKLLITDINELIKAEKERTKKEKPDKPKQDNLHSIQLQNKTTDNSGKNQSENTQVTENYEEKQNKKVDSNTFSKNSIANTDLEKKNLINTTQPDPTVTIENENKGQKKKHQQNYNNFQDTYPKKYKSTINQNYPDIAFKEKVLKQNNYDFNNIDLKKTEINKISEY